MRSNKLELLKMDFSKTLKQCEGKEADWKLFINSYNNLVNAVKEYETLTIENPIIHVAFNKEFNNLRQELQQLEKSLFIRNMITM